MQMAERLRWRPPLAVALSTFSITPAKGPAAATAPTHHLPTVLQTYTIHWRY